MDFFLQQVFALINSETGSLTYHLVVAFSIVAALTSAAAFWHRGENSPVRRLIVGLILLLLFRLVLFAGTALAWQGFINASLALPPLDRAVTLLSIIVIVWMWVFPDTKRMPDAAALLLGLLVVTLAGLAMAWWTSESAALAAAAVPGNPAAGFTGSLPDQVSEFIALFLLGLGLLLLLVRRPDGWSFAIFMFALLIGGHVASLVWPVADSDYPPAVRLAQMAAYPLLLALPVRISASRMHRSEMERTKIAPPPPATVAPSDGATTAMLLNVAGASDPEKTCQSLTAAISSIMEANVCLLASPPDETGYFTIYCGHDRQRDKVLDGASLDSRRAPVLAASLRRNRSLRIRADAPGNDLIALSSVTGLEQPGALLAVPLTASDLTNAYALLVLGPEKGDEWTQQDQRFLERFSASLAYLLHRSEEITQLRQEVSQTRLYLDEAHRESADARRKLGELTEQVNILRRSSMVEEADAFGVSVPNLKKQQGEGSRQAVERLQASLEEIERLQVELDHAEQKIAELSERGRMGADEHMQAISSAAQELREPLSSILGYTDFLLGESIGILGAGQQKLLKRIRVSTERMSRLVDELVEMASVENEPDILEYKSLVLGVVIEEAVSQVGSILREKSLAVHNELPDDLPLLDLDAKALRRVFAQLFEHAAAVTKEGGTLNVRARLESAEGAQDYVLVQVADQGEGIAREELPRVFTNFYQPGSSSAAHLNLPLVKRLVESMAGRIWVDSEPGRGSVFTLLLPVGGESMWRPEDFGGWQA